MPDVVVTVPWRVWRYWLMEGDCAGEPESGEAYEYHLTNLRPEIVPGERVYIVAHGKLRGYAPLVELRKNPPDHAHVRPRYGLVRKGGAVACTLPVGIKGFRGYRYRWWDRAEEIPFPDWQVP